MILTRQQKLFRGNGSAPNARAIADGVITALSPAAWYRNATDVVSSGGFASIWADYASSDKGLVLPGVIGNYASAPDSTAVSVTGDIDIQIRLSAADWTPAVIVPLVSKRINAGQYGYDFYVASTGALIFRYSPDGTASRTATSSAVNTLTDGDISWLRATYNSTTGKVNFYTGGSGASPSWAALGAEQTLTAGAIFDGTDRLDIGTDAGVYANGTVYRAIIKSGIDGTTVFDADFSSQAIGAGSFTESSSNAATVTINTSGAAPAHIGKARDLLQGTGTNQPAYSAGVFTFDGVDNYLKTAPFTLNQPETIYLVVNQVSWTAGDSLIDGNTGNSMRVYQNSSTPGIALYAGATTNQNTDLTVGAFKILTAVYNGASSLLIVNAGTASTGNPGVNNGGGFTLGGTVASYSDIQIKEAVVFAAAHDASTRSSVITALNNALTVF